MPINIGCAVTFEMLYRGIPVKKQVKGLNLYNTITLDMPKIEVPQFVQSIAYILNISNEDAEYGLQTSIFELPTEKLDILNQYIDLCKMYRTKYINNTDINLHMICDLNRSFF